MLFIDAAKFWGKKIKGKPIFNIRTQNKRDRNTKKENATKTKRINEKERKSIYKIKMNNYY